MTCSVFQEASRWKKTPFKIIGSKLCISKIFVQACKNKASERDIKGRFCASRDWQSGTSYRYISKTQASEYISLINDPRHDYDQAYTVNRLGNV
ncbi:hypothetical protein PtB15_17B88 [Puccinia triticina]|nr:hypothetical protein PtB15_17B88 [Puccinia triticina]